MTNRGHRMISSAIVAAGGGVAASIGYLAKATQVNYGSGGESLGGLLVVIGCLLFLVDWVASWREDRLEAPSPKRQGEYSNPTH